MQRRLDLSGSERGALVAVGMLSQRWFQAALVSVVILFVFGHLLRKLSMLMACTKTEGTPTLMNPQRLQTLLNVFAQGPNVSDPPGDRHRTEALCRTLLEHMLGVKLPKVRPSWLMNPTTKRNLELDMYCESLKLAFEFDGSQHETYSPHYHRNADHFKYRQLLDQLKDELCREAGVLLLRIPWHDVSLSDQAKTAHFLEKMLSRTLPVPHIQGALHPRTHRIPHRSLLPPRAPPYPTHHQHRVRSSSANQSHSTPSPGATA